jgi:DNA-binding transcriptional MerR regulator
MNKERYYSLTQTCDRLKVRPHVLRYWEREFEIKVKRNSAGRRIYSASQVDRLATIRHLLHEEKLTVKGARRQLTRMNGPSAHGTPRADAQRSLSGLKKELQSIRALLEPQD